MATIKYNFNPIFIIYATAFLLFLLIWKYIPDGGDYDTYNKLDIIPEYNIKVTKFSMMHGYLEVNTGYIIHSSHLLLKDKQYKALWEMDIPYNLMRIKNNDTIYFIKDNIKYPLIDNDSIWREIRRSRGVHFGKSY